jgi:DNA-binding beta-propeller fold protein YncE
LGTIGELSARVTRRWWPLVALLAIGAIAGLSLSMRASRAATAVTSRVVSSGVAVDLEVAPAARDGALHEGSPAVIRFKVSDAATGAPLSRLGPAAWVTTQAAGARDPRACTEAVKTLLGGSLFRRAEVDLTTFQVLVLGDDATISVIDPRFGFGGSKLLSLVTLKSPGADWVATDDQRRLFVAEPEAGVVAVIDTESFLVTREIAVAGRPSVIALQPDEGYLWVAGDGDEITVINAARLAVAARLHAGAGPHDIAFSDDSRQAFITSRGAGTVAIADVRALEIAGTVSTGGAPAAVAFSQSARAAYVADAAGGGIAVVDGTKRAVTARIPVGPAEGVAFDRKGRIGFALLPSRDEVAVFDAADNHVLKSGKLDQGPDQITATDTLAYVRQRGSEIVRMIPIDEAAAPNKPLAAADFAGGQSAPGPAPRVKTIVQAPGEPAVLVANAADRSVYYYREGMAAPMGSFSTYGHTPRGVLVVDRSLREHGAGVYEAAARLPKAGNYDVAVFIDAPRVVHCFPLTVAPDPARAPAPRVAAPVAQPLAPGAVTATGKQAHVRLRLTDKESGKPRDGAKDVEALVYLVPGVWQRRLRAEPEADGVYDVSFVPPEPGIYRVSLESPSLGLTLRTPQYLTVTAERDAAGGSP